MTRVNYPALHASHAGIWLSQPDGQTRAIDRREAIRIAADTPLIMLGAPMVAQRLGYAELSGLDLLELFAFVHPARFIVPTAKAMAHALGVTIIDSSDAAVPQTLLRCADALLATLGDPAWPERVGAWDMAQGLARVRWGWAQEVTNRIALPERGEPSLFAILPEWEEAPPRAQPKTASVSAQDAAQRLAELTAGGGEMRVGQKAMAQTVAQMFDPRAAPGRPTMVLGEAGTGIGKTLAYLAPTDLWTRASGGTVHISTFTKNLQRQLAQETRALCSSDAEHRSRVVVRKGRENYLCLLNLEDALQGGFSGRSAIFARLVARWAVYSRDGDMVGGDLPGWLPNLFRRSGATALTDRRGECIYAGCPHWRRCFIERSARSAMQSDIVIANHALTMVNAARQRSGESAPTRLIFDEGHHLFDAADSIFSIALSGQEAIELRRWVIGPEANARGRRRGLAARLSDVASYDERSATAIDAARMAAMALPSDGWLSRLADDSPAGPIEQLLKMVRAMVYSRSTNTGPGETDPGYGLETEIADPDGPVVAAAAAAAEACDALLRPLLGLGQNLLRLLDESPDWLDTQSRGRIEGAHASLHQRCETLAAWISLANRVGGPCHPDFVDWMAVDRIDGREIDVGIHRRWLDPTRPFADHVLAPAHGLLVTSATLALGDWARAGQRSGARHLPGPAIEFFAESPFDYARQSEVLIITDIKRGDEPALANAYARLIEAIGGGVLGLFTAIRRLRGVHARIADHLARQGLPILSQHVDPIDTGTLVDIFRDDPLASLLGTDALRDGVDVPGQSLRAVIMEGVPWVKPSILHSARRTAMGGAAYDDAIVKTRLAQAFGRLIRRNSDYGRFILLSSAMPSRLLAALPAATPVLRLSLAEALAHIGSSGSDHQAAFAKVGVSGMNDTVQDESLNREMGI